MCFEKEQTVEKGERRKKKEEELIITCNRLAFFRCRSSTSLNSTRFSSTARLAAACSPAVPAAAPEDPEEEEEEEGCVRPATGLDRNVFLAEFVICILTRRDTWHPMSVVVVVCGVCGVCKCVRVRAKKRLNFRRKEVKKKKESQLSARSVNHIRAPKTKNNNREQQQRTTTENNIQPTSGRLSRFVLFFFCHFNFFS